MVSSVRAADPPTPIERLLSPFQRFAETEASGGLVLLACTALALIWANAPFAPSYFALRDARVALGGAPLGLAMPLHHWINDGLMAAFFFLVGLEVKREFLFGELASPRRAALPVAAALGGMVVPALVFTALSGGGELMRGWGIPMATDIAFALGVLALFGPRVPVQLKVFLAALAIADDIGAVVVIALFYSAGVSWTALGLAGVVYGVVLLANRGGLRRPGAYALLGIPLWLALLASGIHASIAGVLMAAAIPARPRLDVRDFVRRGRVALSTLEALAVERVGGVPAPEELEAIRQIEAGATLAQTPLQRIEHALHPWVAFVVVPLFALANAGVRLTDVPPGALPVTVAVVAGLVAGKPVGIMLASWIAARFGAVLPAGVTWRALLGVAALGGIGFTMSIFIANLAFDDPLLRSAKIGILVGSALSALLGWLLLGRALRDGPGLVEAELEERI